MHADQADITEDTVTALVSDQFPRWRDRRVRRVTSHGTVNALFRLGEDIVLRFPLRPSLDAGLRAELVREQELASRVAAHVPVPIPEPLGIGEPGEGYQGPWAAYGWIPGDIATGAVAGDGFARDLAGFVRGLRDMETSGATWDGDSRGGPLSVMDVPVRDALAAGTHLTDAVRLEKLWDRCLAAPRSPDDVWIHADLMPGNLLVRDGRLAAVIDFETMCVGDPAVDLMPAWNLLAPGPRQTFRHELGVDDATWERGRGWAIAQASIALPYYVDSNPVMADTARHTLDAVLELDPPPGRGRDQEPWPGSPRPGSVCPDLR